MNQELLAEMDRAAGVGRCLYQDVQSLTGGKTLPTLDAAKQLAKRYLYEIADGLQAVSDSYTADDQQQHRQMLSVWITIYVLVHQAAAHAAPVIGSSRTTGGLTALPYRQSQMWNSAVYQQEEYAYAARHFVPETIMQHIDTPTYLRKCLWWMQVELAICLQYKEEVPCGR